MNQPVLDVQASSLIQEYIKLRDDKKAMEEQVAAAMEKRFGHRMNEIENILKQLMLSMGVDSLASDAGTAYRRSVVSLTVADGREFRRHIIGLEAWDQVDWRPNKTAVNALVEAGERVPPGLNYKVDLAIGFRKKS